MLSLEPTYRVPSALELTPEKLHDFLSLTSSPSLTDASSPKAETNPEVKGEGNGLVVTPSPPSFAQVREKIIVCGKVKFCF